MNVIFWFVASSIIATTCFTALKINPPLLVQEEKKELSSWYRVHQLRDDFKRFFSGLHTWIKLFLSSLMGIIIYQSILTFFYK